MRILNYKQTDYLYKMNSTSVMLYTVILHWWKNRFTCTVYTYL
jgi:hypothetical protein